MFGIEWTGHSLGDETDRKRGIAAASACCAWQGLDPAQIWHDMVEYEDRDAARRWRVIESHAISSLCMGWKRTPDNASLIWVMA